MNELTDAQLMQRLNDVLSELANRGYELSCEEYVMHVPCEVDTENKLIVFAGKA